MKPIIVTTSKMVSLPINDVDTDQIIPARFLKTTERAGLGRALFRDWRRTGGPAAALDTVDSKTHRVLLAGENFGCGSSREHAPWALADWGFKAILGLSFADIFLNNALKNGLLPVALPRPVHERLVSAVQTSPDEEVTIDLQAQRVVLPEGLGVHAFTIDAFARHRLLTGTDELGYLRGFEDQITAFEDGSGEAA